MHQAWFYPEPGVQTDCESQLWFAQGERDGAAARLELGGDLDIATVDVLAQWVEGLHLDGEPIVVVDLSHLRFCDACGLAGLLAMDRALAREGRHLTLRNVPPMTRRIMALTRVDALLDVA